MSKQQTSAVRPLSMLLVLFGIFLSTDYLALDTANSAEIEKPKLVKFGSSFALIPVHATRDITKPSLCRGSLKETISQQGAYAKSNEFSKARISDSFIQQSRNALIKKTPRIVITRELDIDQLTLFTWDQSEALEISNPGVYGLRVLLALFNFAKANDLKASHLPLSKGELEKLGLENAHFHWLRLLHYAEHTREVSREVSPRRRFGMPHITLPSGQAIRLDDSSQFYMTETGAKAAQAILDQYDFSDAQLEIDSHTSTALQSPGPELDLALVRPLPILTWIDQTLIITPQLQLDSPE